MANATSERDFVLSKGNNIPIINLDDDDDDDDDLKPDEDYKLFFDQLRDDTKSGPLFESTIRYEVDNEESETRKFDIFSGDVKLGSENLVVMTQETEHKNRVLKQRERKNVELMAQIKRDNRVAERRKRKFSELEEATRRDNRVKRKMSEFKVENLKDVTVLSDQEYTQQDSNVSEFSELKVETLSDGYTEVESLSDVAVVSDREYSQQDNNVSKFQDLEVETIRDDADQDKVETLRNVPVSQRSEGVSVERRKRKVGSVDSDYSSYLTWLEDCLKPMEDVQNDQSHLDPPVSDALRESTTVPEKVVQNDESHLDTSVLDALKESTMVPEEVVELVKVKEEQVDLESWSYKDDDDIIAVSDNPFKDGEATPFVVSKSAINLEEGSKKDESSTCWFKKELMDVLKKPFDRMELRRLYKEVSKQRPMTRHREFRRGREKTCTTEDLGQSYLEKYSDFYEEYKLVDRVDKAKALKLLRGFFFYLENASRDGAFKPWDKNKQCL